MRVVLDTNVILVAIPRQSKYRVIFEEILKGTFELIVSNNIFNEYHEIIALKNSPGRVGVLVREDTNQGNWIVFWAGF